MFIFVLHQVIDGIESLTGVIPQIEGILATQIMGNANFIVL
ncbi:unnamed protein product, partial [marine sediment metagenome]